MITLKEIRERLDFGLLAVKEVKGTAVKIGFLTFTIQDYKETPGDGFPNKWYLKRNGQNYIFTPYSGLERV